MLWVLFRYFLFASASILLLHPYLAGANWPVARYTNGTVGLINDGGEVHVQSAKLQVNGRLKVEGDLSVKGSLSVGSSSLLPPKCMPPGGDKLIYNGTHWFCVCVENWSGETCETPPPPSLVLSVGGLHVCAILNGGCVKCFGHNGYGQLGYGNSEWSEWNDLGDNLPALDLGIGHTAKALSTADGISCAILNDDTVKCWGKNDNGMLALGEKGWDTRRGDDANEMGDNLPAVDLGTGRTAKAISCGEWSICAILDDDSVKCWGAGSRLGLGDTNTRGDDANEMGDNLPAVNLGTGRTAKAISIGSGNTCAILDDDSLKCWGSGYHGILGLGDTEDRGNSADEMGDNLPTVDLGTGRTVTSVSVGHYFTCALLDNGSVKCWGWNEYDNLGLGDTYSRGDDADEMGDYLPAVDLGTGRTAKAISVGTTHTCAILDDGTVKCFGYNALGHLGLGDTEGRGNSASDMGDNLPTVDLGTGRTAMTISAGNGRTCALLDDDSVKCWGRGIGDSANEMGNNLPVQKFGTCA